MVVHNWKTNCMVIDKFAVDIGWIGWYTVAIIRAAQKIIIEKPASMCRRYFWHNRRYVCTFLSRFGNKMA